MALTGTTFVDGAGDDAEDGSLSAPATPQASSSSYTVSGSFGLPQPLCLQVISEKLDAQNQLLAYQSQIIALMAQKLGVILP